jgi:hypothetical protein
MYQRRGFFRSIAVMALMACAAFSTSVYEAVVMPVLTMYHALKRTVVDWVHRALAACSCVLVLKPAAVFASAKSFVLRIMRRQRPHVTPGWRWCPST